MVQCLDCVIIFNDDFKKTHDKNQHKGDKMAVKHVDAPNNPFKLLVKVKGKLTKIYRS